MDTRDRTTTSINTAARLMGVSVETLRKRLQRGAIDGFKAEDGTWRVVLDMSGQDFPGHAGTGAGPDEPEALDEVLREVRGLRQQVSLLAEALKDLAIILQEMHGRVMADPPAPPPAEAEDLDWPGGIRRPDGLAGQAVDPDDALAEPSGPPPVLTQAQARHLLMAVLEVVERQSANTPPE